MIPKGKRTAVLAGLALAGVAAWATLSAPELARRWHLWRLWREPGYLQKVLDAPAGTAAGDAVERFIREPKAKQEVFEAYLAKVTERSEDLGHKLRGWSCDEVLFLVRPDYRLDYLGLRRNGRSGGLEPYIPIPELLAVRLRAIQALLTSEPPPLTSASYSYRFFRFFRADDEPGGDSFWRGMGKHFKGPYCVGFVTNAPPYPEPLERLQALPVVPKRYGPNP